MKDLKKIVLFALIVFAQNHVFGVTVTAIYGQRSESEVFGDYGLYLKKIEMICYQDKAQFIIKKPQISWVGFILQDKDKEKWIEGVLTEVDFQEELARFRKQNKQQKKIEN